MKKRLGKIIFAVLFLLPVWAQAVPITIQISGNVTSASGSAIIGTIHIGDIFNGSYTYDSAAINTSIRSDIGTYAHNSPYGIDLSLGAFEFKTTTAHVGQFIMGITNNLTTNPCDGYYVISTQNLPLSNGLTVDTIHWYLEDTTQTALSSIALPLTAPVLSQWNSNYLEIYGWDAVGNAFSIYGTVTQATPEPATSVFLLMAGAFLLRRR